MKSFAQIAFENLTHVTLNKRKLENQKNTYWSHLTKPPTITLGLDKYTTVHVLTIGIESLPSSLPTWTSHVNVVDHDDLLFIFGG